MGSRFLRPNSPGFLLSPNAGDELTAEEELVVQAISGGTYFVENEVPSGSVNGTDGTDGNAVFTTANTVNPTSSIEVWLNGVKMKGGGVDYTFSSTDTITFVSGKIPITGDLLLVNYRRSP